MFTNKLLKHEQKCPRKGILRKNCRCFWKIQESNVSKKTKQFDYLGVFLLGLFEEPLTPGGEAITSNIVKQTRKDKQRN